MKTISNTNCCSKRKRRTAGIRLLPASAQSLNQSKASEVQVWKHPQWQEMQLSEASNVHFQTSQQNGGKDERFCDGGCFSASSLHRGSPLTCDAVILPPETGRGVCRVKVLPPSCNPAHRWDRRTPAAYFLLAARHDCLWKINQRSSAPLCYIVADTHHINKLKLPDAMSVFWLVFAGKRWSVFHNRSIWPNSPLLSDTKGCAPPNIAVHFQDKYSCFLHISEVMERQHKALAAAHSLYTVILKLQPFLSTSFTHPLYPKPLRYYTYQKAISNI